MFAGRVIKFVIEALEQQLRVQTGKKVIMDYQGFPYVLAGDGAASDVAERTVYDVVCGIGESDVKFVRYLPMTEHAIILDAVDSDYVIIGLSQIERMTRVGLKAPGIFVRRILLHPTPAAVSAAAVMRGGGAGGGVTKKKPVVKKNAAKRPLDDFLMPSDDTMSAIPEGNKENVDPNQAAFKKSGREYEFADCYEIVRTLKDTFGRRTPEELKPYTIQIFCFAVALCGCDFTRGVSWLNGSTFTKFSDFMWPGLCAAATVDPATGIVVMKPRVVAERVVGELWKKEQFKKLCAGPAMKNATLEMLYAELSENTTISAFRRDRLVTPTELCCLVRNANWTNFYWGDPEKCPCAVWGGDYGFTQVKDGAKVHFDDKIPLPPSTAKVPLSVMPPPAHYFLPR